MEVPGGQFSIATIEIEVSVVIEMKILQRKTVILLRVLKTDDSVWQDATTVDAMKEQLEHRTNVSAAQQKLSFRGRKLENGHVALEYEIPKNEVGVTLVMRERTLTAAEKRQDVSRNDGLRINNERLCIENEEFCI